MVPVNTEFQDAGRVVSATFECAGEPQPLENGGLGWFAVSNHLPWRYDCSLRFHCSITKPKAGYGYPEPAPGTHKFADAYGDLSITARRLTFSFRIPDCLGGRKKLNFVWPQPILFEDQLYHCQTRLETHAPKDISMRRRPGNLDTVGGIEFVLPDGQILGAIADSEDGRGATDRLLSRLKTRRWRA
jgi:hypothetical protein